MKVLEFAFVGHPVESLRRARQFYEKILGLPVPKAIDGTLESDQGFLEYEIGPHTLAITTTWTDGKPVDAPSSGLVLEVDDFAEAIRQLEDNCVEFEMGPFEGPSCSIAVILDPDGNRIGIHKRRVT